LYSKESYLRNLYVYDYSVLTTTEKITLAVIQRIREQEHRRSHNENGTVGGERESIRENELTSSTSFAVNCLLRSTLEKQEDTSYSVLLW
jgi:hypothetical protein